MTGNKGDFAPVLISPAEGVRLTSKHITLESVHRATAITKEWKSQSTGENGNTDILWMLGAVYEIGRIQGLREARQRNSVLVNLR